MKKIALSLCLSTILVTWLLRSNANINNFSPSFAYASDGPDNELTQKKFVYVPGHQDQEQRITKSGFKARQQKYKPLKKTKTPKNRKISGKQKTKHLVNQPRSFSKVIKLDELYDAKDPLKKTLLDQAHNPQKYLSKTSALSATSSKEESKISNRLSAFDFKVIEFNPGLNAENESIMEPLSWPYIYAAVSGPPDFSLYENSKQKEKILSLGHRGSIVLKVVGGYIFDGQGDDFKIFENPFVTSDQNVYAETALVAVAQENKPEKYIYFNCQSHIPPFENCAGVRPVFYHSGADLNEVGGDAFDLADVGIDRIQYIKIEDTGDNVAYFLGDEGFDLDSMAIIHGEKF
ncbi:hypothetical protein MRY82_08760 [bacterium]|nr:hypothetical protein [bacterium]